MQGVEIMNTSQKNETFLTAYKFWVIAFQTNIETHFHRRILMLIVIKLDTTIGRPARSAQMLAPHRHLEKGRKAKWEIKKSKRFNNYGKQHQFLRIRKLRPLSPFAMKSNEGNHRNNKRRRWLGTWPRAAPAKIIYHTDELNSDKPNS